MRSSLTSCEALDATLPEGLDRFPTFDREWVPADNFFGATVGHDGNLMLARGDIWVYSPQGDLIDTFRPTVDGQDHSVGHIHYLYDRYYLSSRTDMMVFDTDWGFIRAWPDTIMRPTSGVRFVSFTVDNCGNVYSLRFDDEAVIKYSAYGDSLGVWRTHGPDPGTTNWPGGIAYWDGTVYVSDIFHNRVLMFTEDGVLIGQIGERGGSLLALPSGIAFDQEGFLYIVDRSHRRVVKVTARGALMMIIGVDAAPSPNDPLGIALGRGEAFVFLAHDEIQRYYVSPTVE